jgi:hypothetical protein
MVALSYLALALLLAACAKYATVSNAAEPAHHEVHGAVPSPAN